jgi:hypothetical protein
VAGVAPDEQSLAELQIQAVVASWAKLEQICRDAYPSMLALNG